jgi:hypothetical protein
MGLSKKKERTKRVVNKKVLVGAKQVSGPAEFRVGDTSHREDNIEVKLGKGSDAVKIIIERKVVRDTVDKVVPVMKEALQAVVNALKPMKDDELLEYIDKKKKADEKKGGDSNGTK